MTIEETLASAAAAGARALYGAQITKEQVQLQKTPKGMQGQLTVVCFPFVKIARKRPDAVSEELGHYMQEQLPGVVAAYHTKGGYLNVEVATQAWMDLLSEIRSQKRFAFIEPTEHSPLVMIEYSSPNTNKPLHLGHVRNNLLGAALARILAANGNRVVRTNIVNDRGVHICKSMIAWLRWGEGATPESTGKKGDHLVGDCYVAFEKHYREEVAALVAGGMEEEQAKQEAPLIKEAHAMLVKWEQGDEQVRALWRRMNEWVYAGFDATYRRLGVGFDKIYYESDTYLVGKEKVLEGLDKGLFHKREDGSVWADLRGEGLDEKLLLRSDGTSVYMTQDIGTAKLRYEDYPIDRMIYVVGNEQEYHFQVLSILLDKLGFSWGKDLVHFSYGMVELPNGKMKSREGTVVDADDLIDQMEANAYSVSKEMTKKIQLSEEEAREVARKVGMGALKYFILKVDARKGMLFNPEESIDFNGNTGPFIQYTYARIASILRKAAEQGTDIPEQLPADMALEEKEVGLILKLHGFEAALRQAGATYSPSGLCAYCYDLTKEFNQFYHDFTILGEPDTHKRAFRLALSQTVAQVVKNGMGLLGIEMPERM